MHPEPDSSSVLLERVLGMTCSVFDAYTAVLFLRDGDGYRLAAAFSLGDAVDRKARLQEGQGLVGWMLRNRQPLSIGNFDQKRGRLGYYRQGEESGVKAFMGCPLDDGEGALAVDTKRTYAFGPKEQKLLHQFAQLVGELRGSRSRDASDLRRQEYSACLRRLLELRRRSPRWAVYLENFLTLVADASGMQVAFLAVRDENGRTFSLEGANQPFLDDPEAAREPFAIGSGLVGWVFKNGAPVYCGLGDPSLAKTSLLGRELSGPRFKSAICLPLPVHRRTRGVLALVHEEPRVVTEELKSFLDLVAEHLALFLENLYLKNRLEAAAAKQSR